MTKFYVRITLEDVIDAEDIDEARGLTDDWASALGDREQCKVFYTETWPKGESDHDSFYDQEVSHG